MVNEWNRDVESNDRSKGSFTFVEVLPLCVVAFCCTALSNLFALKKKNSLQVGFGRLRNCLAPDSWFDFASPK